MSRKVGLGRGIDALFLENTEEIGKSGKTELRIAQIEPKTGQPRKNFEPEALSFLADSISAHGVLQPILVREITPDRYQIVAGERRWRASKLAGLSDIPAIILDSDEKEASQIALIENVQREDLNAIEEAMAYQSLADDHAMTQEELSSRIGKSRSAIANAMRLLDLPDELLSDVASGILSAGHARALLGLKDQDLMIALGKKAIKQGLSVRAVENEVRSLNKKLENQEEIDENEQTFEVDYVAELERRVMTNLGRRVKIAAKGVAKSVTLYFNDNDDLDDLLRQICGDAFAGEY